MYRKERNEKLNAFDHLEHEEEKHRNMSKFVHERLLQKLYHHAPPSEDFISDIIKAHKFESKVILYLCLENLQIVSLPYDVIEHIIHSIDFEYIDDLDNNIKLIPNDIYNYSKLVYKDNHIINILLEKYHFAALLCKFIKDISCTQVIFNKSEVSFPRYLEPR